MGKRCSKPIFTRNENSREERKSIEIRDFITFSFKDFDDTQPKENPENLDIWEREGLLQPLLIRLKELSQLTRDEAVKQKQIKIYGDFPPKTEFIHPQHVNNNVTWAVIKTVGGQKGVVAGYIIESTFYIVFFR